MVDNRESITAKLCSYARAWHSNKIRNKVFDDYLAYDMMGKENYDELSEWIRSEFSLEKGEQTDYFLNEYFATIPLSRIQFTEQRLKKFAEQNGKIQYVICGAGADTFSFRNDNPDIEVFEVDHPDTQRYKLDRVRELEWNIPKNAHFVSVDFEKEAMTDKLLDAGFDTNVKSFFCILGVSYYLTLPVFSGTLRQIAELSAPYSVLVFDYPQRDGDFPERVHKLERITANLGEVMQGGFTYNEVSRALYSLGFQIDTFLTPEKIQKKYFDGRDDNLRAFENVNLLSATFTNLPEFE
ncbi:MAG: class I SAM-dependent methyltransferase [Oscillospiraceae bacterium]